MNSNEIENILRTKMLEELRTINFEGILEYMKIVGWNWGMQIVNKNSMIQLLEELFESAVGTFLKNKTHAHCGSGGFHVVIFNWDSGLQVDVYFDISDEPKSVLQGLREKVYR